MGGSEGCIHTLHPASIGNFHDSDLEFFLLFCRSFLHQASSLAKQMDALNMTTDAEMKEQERFVLICLNFDAVNSDVF